MLPIENALHGSVHANYDLLRTHGLVIVGEVQLRIRHHLLALEGVALGDVRRVLSHPQALGQCARWLRSNLPHADVVAAYDTAGAARQVARERLADAAAIASASAGREYGLASLGASIEDNPQNFTRFLVLARPDDAAPVTHADVPGGSKTSVVFALQKNLPGGLFKSLAVFALREIDLLKIESRPLVGSPGEYLFYLDLAGHTDDAPVRRALDHLGEITSELKVLGAYPRGAVVGS